MNRRVRACHVSAALLCLVSTALGQLNREAPQYTPTIDGVITAEEMAGQLEIAMSWPMPNGFIAFAGAGDGVDDLSATWYVSWDEINLNFSAVVRDNTPDYRIDSGGSGNVPYNAQDLIQPTFNPFNDPDNFFAPDPGGGPAAIYDMVVNTADDFGPDIYRHGADAADRRIRNDFHRRNRKPGRGRLCAGGLDPLVGGDGRCGF